MRIGEVIGCQAVCVCQRVEIGHRWIADYSREAMVFQHYEKDVVHGGNKAAGRSIAGGTGRASSTAGQETDEAQKCQTGAEAPRK